MNKQDEEKAREIANQSPVYFMHIYNGALEMAAWKEQQMKEALQTKYEKGRFDMIEEMTKDAVEGDIFREIKSPSNIEFQLRSKRFKMEGIKLGDKVKIVVLKTE